MVRREGPWRRVHFQTVRTDDVAFSERGLKEHRKTHKFENKSPRGEGDEVNCGV